MLFEAVESEKKRNPEGKIGDFWTPRGLCKSSERTNRPDKRQATLTSMTRGDLHQKHTV